MRRIRKRDFSVTGLVPWEIQLKQSLSTAETGEGRKSVDRTRWSALASSAIMNHANGHIDVASEI
jgi:hypothetical protein